MQAKNACEGIMSNPQLEGAINSLVRSCYNRHRDLMLDSAYDVDDLRQELMLVLCEEKPRSEDRCYQQLCTDRLKDITTRLRRRLTNSDGECVDFVSYDESEEST